MKLLDYNVIIKFKIIKFIKLVINNLKLINIIINIIILNNNKLIEFS